MFYSEPVILNLVEELPHFCLAIFLILSIWLCSFIEIALRHGCSPVNCCIFSEHLFLGTPLGDCLWSWSRNPFFAGQQPKSGLISAIGSIENIDEYKILFPMVHNRMGFAKEKNLYFAWSRDPFFKGSQDGQRRPKINYKLFINQPKILFPLAPNLIGFVNQHILPMTAWSRD